MSSKVRGADAYLPEGRSLRALAEAADACRGCELYRNTNGAVLGAGPGSARLMLVGEQPGDQEDRQGRPFVGPAGHLLARALEDAGISLDDVYRTNAVKHFRHREQGKRRLHVTPDLSHMVACAPWLEAEIDAIQPVGLVVLGASAGKAVYGGSFRLGPARGGPHPWPDDSLLALASPPEWLVATTHPSAALRAGDKRDEVLAGLVADLVVAREGLAGG